MNVKIFSKNNCMQCKMVKRFLTDNQIDFEEVNIDEQPDAIEWLKAQGFQSVPVITSDAQPVIGFRPDQLRKLASQSPVNRNGKERRIGFDGIEALVFAVNSPNPFLQHETIFTIKIWNEGWAYL